MQKSNTEKSKFRSGLFVNEHRISYSDLPPKDIILMTVKKNPFSIETECANIKISIVTSIEWKSHINNILHGGVNERSTQICFKNVLLV